MSNKRTPNPARPDADNPEWTLNDIAMARPAAEVLPGLIGDKATQELFRRGRGRPLKATRKVNQTIRLDPDVLAAYQPEGRGWQTQRSVARSHARATEVKRGGKRSLGLARSIDRPDMGSAARFVPISVKLQATACQ